MNNLKFIVIYDRHKLKTSKRVRGIVGKLYSFLDDRKWHNDRGFDLMQRIFQYVHVRASHGSAANRDKWKNAEARLMKRLKRRI